MITFDENKKLFHLQTPNTSYVIGLLDDYVVRHLYYGKRLERLDGMDCTDRYGAAFCVVDKYFADINFDGSTELVPQDYSFFGSCDLRKPAFHAQYEDGSRITKMTYVSHKIFGGKPKLSGLPATYTEDDSEADTLEITMRDSLTGLILVYRYSVYNTCDAITRSITVKNGGSEFQH